jgi:uncharacterized protein YndB with AHSA1/START domain
MFIAFGIMLIVLGSFLAAAGNKPNTFRVQRTTCIEAPPEKIFALISDFHSWGHWSPYEKLDPAMKKTHTGASSGNGSVYEWEGNNKVGKGRMEITQVVPASKVIIKLDFIKPIEGHNIAEFTLESKGDSTNVTWAMHGPSPYIMKLMGIFFSMDRMVGKEFDAGLANLKALTEK